MGCYVETVQGPSREEYERWQGMGYTGDYERYAATKNRQAGTKVFLCGDLGDSCADCMAVGVYLCDYPVGDGKTCDRTICATHSAKVGENMHYCQTHNVEWLAYRQRHRRTGRGRVTDKGGCDGG